MISTNKVLSQVLDESTYDACAYVGTSNQPELPNFCLNTHIDCCYFAFQWQTYVYYSCVNKRRLIASVEKSNMTAGFLYDVSDEAFAILNNILYSNCSDNSDVIVSNAKIEPPSLKLDQRRKLYKDGEYNYYEEEEHKAFYQNFFYYLSEISYKLFRFLENQTRKFFY